MCAFEPLFLEGGSLGKTDEKRAKITQISLIRGTHIWVVWGWIWGLTQRIKDAFFAFVRA